MADSNPKMSPLAEPKAKKENSVFEYNVAAQASTPAQQKPNPASPLAAG
jgi:hypothetical protein